jgi:hypothetical protein
MPLDQHRKARAPKEREKRRGANLSALRAWHRCFLIQGPRASRLPLATFFSAPSGMFKCDLDHI